MDYQNPYARLNNLVESWYYKESGRIHIPLEPTNFGNWWVAVGSPTRSFRHTIASVRVGYISYNIFYTPLIVSPSTLDLNRRLQKDPSRFVLEHSLYIRNGKVHSDG